MSINKRTNNQKPPLSERLVKDILSSLADSLSNNSVKENVSPFKIKAIRFDQSFHTLFTEFLYILKLISLIITTVQLPLSQPFAFTSANGFYYAFTGTTISFSPMPSARTVRRASPGFWPARRTARARPW